MHLEWLLNPLTGYAAAAVAIVLSVALFIGIKWEMAQARALARESEDARASEQTVVRGLEAELASLRESVRHLEAAPPGRPGGLAVNLTKRAQALRMHRRGEAIPSIAAALETPGNEIELLLKVHALTGEGERKAS